TIANFPVATSAVGTSIGVTISADFNATVTTTLTINPAVLSTVVVNPAAVIGGTASIGTVTLSGPAAPGGTVVALASDNALASVPASVTVTAGATTATFSVNTIAVAAQISANILGNYLETASGSFSVAPAGLVSLTMNSSSVAGGSSTVGTVTLS